LAGPSSSDACGQVIVDLDGGLVLAHSDKQDAAATWKKTYGHHPLMGFERAGPESRWQHYCGENAGSNTATDHITTTQLALAQLPKHYRRGRRTLIRTDSAGGTHEFVAWLAQRGRWLSYSVCMTITEQIHQAVGKIPATADGQPGVLHPHLPRRRRPDHHRAHPVLPAPARSCRSEAGAQLGQPAGIAGGLVPRLGGSGHLL
jgi:hypothetical protein